MRVLTRQRLGRILLVALALTVIWYLGSQTQATTTPFKCAPAAKACDP